MLSKPEISIIVPVYKVESFLVECLNSILRQSFKDFELLLVDDGSPDGCPQICDEYKLKDSRVVTFHKKNGGLADARNFGLNHATGRYIVFVDSDDLLAENALKDLYYEITTSNADVVLGKIVRFNSEDGKSYPYTRLKKYKRLSGIETLKMLLKGNQLNISVCGGIYKREIWDKVRMPVGYVCEDWYVMPDIYLQKEVTVVFLPTLVYLYRNNTQSTMSGLYRQCSSQVIDVAEHVIQAIKQADRSIYYDTLWSNIRRVWKYVGIIYSHKRRNDELNFLSKVRSLIKSYWADLIIAGNMTTAERIGVWTFCFCEPVCRLLYLLKYSKRII